jgi:hypothetical protein
MKFIVGSKGFYVTHHFDKENLTNIIEWTSVARNAKVFEKTKTAVQVIEKLNLDAFVWNVTKETPIKDRWYISNKSDSYYTGQKNPYNIWKPVRAIMLNESDKKFLSGQNDNRNTYTYEEAVELCNKKNSEIKEYIEKSLL